MSETLKSAAFSANLSDKDKRKVEELGKALTVHKQLLSMPSDTAKAVYNNLPVNQQQSLVQNFGTETEEEKPKQGWLGTANHYTGYQVYKAFNFLADRVSQTYRAAVIPIIERGEIGFAWDEAGKDGEQVYNTGRLQKAKTKYGDAQIRIAQKISEGADIADLINNATEEEKFYLRIADPTNNNIVNGIDSNKEAREESGSE